MTADEYDVVVVGAGVIGCVAARELAPDHDVLVLDRAGVAAEATGLSAGLVSPTLFYGDLPAVARHANDFFREFDGTGQFSFTERDRLDLVGEDEPGDVDEESDADEAGDADKAGDADEEIEDTVEQAQETAEQRSKAGFPVSYLDAEEVARRYPSFDVSDFAGAIFYGDTGWVDPYSYATALKQDAEASGATFEMGVTVRDVRTDSGSVTGLATDDGPRLADSVVVAAGWRTADLLADHVSLPVRPYRTQVVVLEPDEALPGDFPLVRVGSEELYVRPEHNGDLLVGGSHHTLDDPVSASANADEEFQMQVADFVPTLLDGFERAGFVNDWAGVDAGTPDGRPVIDEPEEAPDGLVVAAGFNGLGVTISPVAGTLVRGLVTDERLPFDPTPFGLGRLRSEGDSFDIHYTSEI